jgi:16S rRNA (cytosine967-C5)-methyltransferase
MIAPARRAALDALRDAASGRRDLGEVLDQARRALTDARDVALFHELVVGTLRWQSRLDAAIAQLSRTPLAALDRDVLLALRLGAYQLLYLTRVPAAAAVNDAVAQVRAARKSSATGLVNAVLRRLARGEGQGLPSRPGRPVEEDRDAWVAHLAAVHAHPPWLVARWLAREPLEVVEAWLAYDNATPEITLRVNPLVAQSRAAGAAALAASGVETTPSPRTSWGLRVVGGAVATAAAVADGTCLIQDEGSQLAGALAPVPDGARVLDVCAAPGGKALIYAAAAGRRGLVVAGDARAARVALLAETLRRGHASRTPVVHLDPDAPLPFRRQFDVVVVDAPCSGLGTLRRDPDIKWRRTAEDLPRFAARQLDLVRRGAAMVGAGGRLVYLTCSTEPEENDAVLAEARAALPSFRVATGPVSAEVAPYVGADRCFRTQPGRHGLDGYFGVVLERIGDPLAPDSGL